MRRLISFFLALIVGVAIIPLPFGLSPVEAAPAGSHSTNVGIANPSGVDITDYQVIIDLNGSNIDFSTADPDGSDLRVLDSANNPLPYWIEEWDAANQTARVWVRLDIPATGTNIKLTYGSPGATSESDGDKVFMFFDEFIYVDSNGTTVLDPNKWNVLYGTWAVTNGTLSPTGYYSYSIDTVYTRDFVVEDGIIEMQFSPLNTRCPGCYYVGTSVLGRYNTSIGDTYLFNAGGYSYAYEIARWPSIPQPSWTVLAKTYDNYLTLAEGIDYRFRVTLNGPSIKFDVLKGSLSGTHLEVNDTTIPRGAVGISTWQMARVDWIFVRKYVPVEPVVTVGQMVKITEEESPYQTYRMLSLFWYLRYTRMEEEYDSLYDDAVQYGVNNETLAKSHGEFDTAGEYFANIDKTKLLQGNILTLPDLRKAYIHMSEAMGILRDSMT